MPLCLSNNIHIDVPAVKNMVRFGEKFVQSVNEFKISVNYETLRHEDLILPQKLGTAVHVPHIVIFLLFP